MMKVKSNNKNYQSKMVKQVREWDYLSKRLTEVEKGLTIVEKKHHMLQKQFNYHAHEVTKVQVDISEEIHSLKQEANSNLLRDRIERISQNLDEVKLEIQSVGSNRIQSLENEIRLSIFEVKDSFEIKSQSIIDESKSYINRTVFQLKELLKKYMKEQNEIENKIERINLFENKKEESNVFSRYSMPMPNKGKETPVRFFDESHVKSIPSKIEIEPSSLNEHSSTKRVNYLRQKLKEFEKVNKKYEQSQPAPIEQTQSLQKMHKYKDYFEQSESEVEPPSRLYPQEDGKLVMKPSGKRNHTNY